MPKIPIYQEQVNPGVTRALSAEAPKPVPGAFGEQVGQAIQRLGEQGVESSNVMARHFIRMEIEDENRENDNLLSKFNVDMQNLMYKAPDGSDKGGLLTRQMDNALGATEEFSKQYQTTRDSYLAQTKTPRQRDALLSALESQRASLGNQVSAYEARQRSAASLAALDSFLKTQVDNAYAGVGDMKAALAAGPESLTYGRIVDGLKLQGFGDEAIKAKIQEYNGALVAATVSRLSNLNGDYKTAQQVLEENKGLVPEKIYVGITADLKEKGRTAREFEINQRLYSELKNVPDILTKATDTIMADAGLNSEEKAEQIRSFTSYYQIQQHNENVRVANLVQGEYTQLQSLYTKKASIEAAYKQIDTYCASNNVPLDTKLGLRNVANALWGGGPGSGSGLDPDSPQVQMAWYEMTTEVNKGMLTNEWEALAKYGKRIPFSMMKSVFSSLQTAGADKDNAFKTRAMDLMKAGGILKPEAQVEIWQDFGVYAEAFRNKNNGKMSDTDRLNILKDVLLGKYKTKGFSGKGWELPNIFNGRAINWQMDKELSKPIADLGGTPYVLVKWDKETKIGIIQEVRMKNGRRELGPARKIYDR